MSPPSGFLQFEFHDFKSENIIVPFFYFFLYFLESAASASK